MKINIEDRKDVVKIQFKDYEITICDTHIVIYKDGQAVVHYRDCDKLNLLESSIFS